MDSPAGRPEALYEDSLDQFSKRYRQLVCAPSEHAARQTVWASAAVFAQGFKATSDILSVYQHRPALDSTWPFDAMLLGFPPRNDEFRREAVCNQIRFVFVAENLHSLSRLGHDEMDGKMHQESV